MLLFGRVTLYTMSVCGDTHKDTDIHDKTESGPWPRRQGSSPRVAAGRRGSEAALSPSAARSSWRRQRLSGTGRVILSLVSRINEFLLRDKMNCTVGFVN